MKREIIYDKVHIESCEIGQRAILQVTDHSGLTQRIQTSIVENMKISCTGEIAITTKRTIYRCY